MFDLSHNDDMVIFFFRGMERALKKSGEFMNRLVDARLKVKPAKYMFAQDHVRFLCHDVGCLKRSPSEIKIKAFQNFLTP